MTPLNPIFAILIYTIAFLTVYIINLKYKITTDHLRYENIDALRGLLALGVFICHSSVWHQYLQIKSWETPKSNLYTQLGQTSVSIFFMITAFLFISRLLNTTEKVFNWKALFISRFFRLTPMYIVSIAILISIILIISNWEINVGTLSFLKDIFYWAAFTIMGKPNINNSDYTNIINADVVWSLPFEWLFYFSLPLISLVILKRRPSILYILVSLIFMFFFFKARGLNEEHLFSFLGGAIAPFIIKYYNKKIEYNSILFSIIITICLGLILLFETSDNYICKLLIIIIFNLIALGNNFFGILKSSRLKLLGEISYSTYLIHGIILFIVMYFGYGLERAANLSPTKYCLTIFTVTPILVIVSFVAYKYIERPCMVFSKKIKSAK